MGEYILAWNDPEKHLKLLKTTDALNFA